MTAADRGQVYGALIELVGATICIVGLNAQRWAALWLEKNEDAAANSTYGGWVCILASRCIRSRSVIRRGGDGAGHELEGKG